MKCFAVIAIALTTGSAFALNRVSTGSGNFHSAASWNPAGIPGPGDHVTISPGHTIIVDNQCTAQSLTINAGAMLKFGPQTALSLNGAITVLGTAEIAGGDLYQQMPGAPFTIGPMGTVVWQPANNTTAGATIFTNGIENFSPTSNLIIRHWYNYSGVPIGSVVTGNFGNLTINTLTNGLLYEWNQNNEFEQHQVLGTLTIDQGWVVLDKSGSITNTIFGDVILKNVNSYLDFHSGNHPGIFRITTGDLTNIGGALNGICNGNGDVRLTVNGDFTNLGNVVLVYNTGMQGTGNGNAFIKVTGTFTQQTGDFRGIFNLTTTQAGRSEIDFGSMKLLGGIFMGHYACHTAGNRTVMNIRGDAELDFSSPGAKFRCNGLSSLSGTFSNADLQFTIDGDLEVNGPTAAEFTSSGNTGTEIILVKGTTRLNGCTVNFNHGNHSTSLTFREQFLVSGGTTYLSRTDGQLTALLNKGMKITGGNLTVAGGNGNGNLTIGGSFEMTGGAFFMHNNNVQPATHIIYVTVHGNFTHTGGVITFDNHASSTTGNIISLNGNKMNLGGNAVIRSSVMASGGNPGTIYYDQSGVMEYTQSGTASCVNIRQVIHSGCTLRVVSGTMLLASTPSPVTDNFRIAENAILDLGSNQAAAGPDFPYCTVKADANSLLRISRPEGLYQANGSGALHAGNNLQYTLDPECAIEYYGNATQSLTGSVSASRQYGKLHINKPAARVYLASSDVTVRNRLILTAGELFLDGQELTITNGEPDAIEVTLGYIRCETGANGRTGTVTWQNAATGIHLIPFGTDEQDKFRFTFDPVSGTGKSLSVSTRSCARDNRPLPDGIPHLLVNGKEAGVERVIDRWYQVDAPGMTAHIAFGYLPGENTTLPEHQHGNFSAMLWKSPVWTMAGGSGTGSVSQPGTVRVANMGTWGTIGLLANGQTAAADLLDFTAERQGKGTQLDWTVKSMNEADVFIAERSEDGNLYEDIGEITALPVSSQPQEYQYTDQSPPRKLLYYRIRQVDKTDTVKYSQHRVVDHRPGGITGIELESVGPNPFHETFTVSYMMPENGTVTVELTAANGQLVFLEQVDAFEGNNKYVFRKEGNIPPGLYLLSVSDGKRKQHHKLFHI
jgi:hypothetical protein